MHISQKHFYCSHISSHLYLEVKYFKIQCLCVCVCVHLLVCMDTFIVFCLCVHRCVYTCLPKVLLFLCFLSSPQCSLYREQARWCWGRGASCT